MHLKASLCKVVIKKKREYAGIETRSTRERKISYKIKEGRLID